MAWSDMRQESRGVDPSALSEELRSVEVEMAQQRALLSYIAQPRQVVMVEPRV